MDKHILFSRKPVLLFWLLLCAYAPSISSAGTLVERAALTSATNCNVTTTNQRTNHTFFACQNGTFTWKNLTGEQTLVFVKRTTPFNLCLQLQKMPHDLSISIAAIRDVSISITRIFTPHVTTCFHSHCGNVTLTLTAVDSTGRNAAMTEQSISLKFTADNMQICDKCEHSCMAHCACKSSYVLGGYPISFQEEYQNGTNVMVYQVLVKNYYRYNGTFNPDFIPYLSSPNDKHIFANATKHISIVTQCKLTVGPGHMYFFSGDGLSSSNVLGLERVSLCCMGYSRKQNLSTYINTLISGQCAEV